MLNNKDNLWILTEERPKKEVIKKIIEKTNNYKNLSIKIENFKIEPVIKDNKFLHIFKISQVKSKKIDNIFIRLISSRSSFVDFLIFKQKKEPNPEQILKNCIYAIEETKTNSYDSRNTAMGQRSSKFNTINYYILKHKAETKPIMFFSHEQADEDHKSVNFINRSLYHLECGIEFWGKNSSNFKKFTSLDEFIKIKNEIADTNTRKNDTPIRITKEKELIKISALLANPNNNNKNYTGRIGHDPNMGQIPLIAKVIRTLGWTKKIVITNHQVVQKRIGVNKFTNLASFINFELEDCKLPKSNFNFDYWEYEKDKEKVATILAQIILENNNLITIFDNHGGCEKSYFYNKSNQEIKIDKKFSADGGKIPDIVMRDDENKIIYQFEGKKFQSLDNGLEEIKHFDLFEEKFLKVHYPKYEYKRSLVINGGKKSGIKEVDFQLDSESFLNFRNKTNFSF